MSSTKLFPIDPKNLKHIELIDKFEKENKISTPIGKYTKKEETSNDISIELVLEIKDRVEDICHLQGVKDMKSCTISFVEKQKKKRKIIPLATSYAMEMLGMEEVFIKINPNDKNMLEYLESNNFECLGMEKGSIIYLKERINTLGMVQ